MSQGRKEVMEESKVKGIATGALTVGTVTVGILLGPIAAAIAAVPTAYVGYRWWKHRSKNGIRF